MAKDPELLAHQQWLGYLQPVGLVVSAPALLQCQAHVNANVATEHQRFLEHVNEGLVVGQTTPMPSIKDLRKLLTAVFGWQDADLVEAADPRAAALEAVLPEYHETLRPTYAVPDDPKAKPPTWLMLIQEVAMGTPLDDASSADERRWHATPHARFERLLRETQVPIGLLSNATHLRLVYAPRGETAGHVTFPVQAMTEVAGRPIFAALQMLLSSERLFSLPDKQRLPSILAESRKYQNTVSTELAQQVLAALYELLRGFQAADDLRKGGLLRDVLSSDPDQVYAGLLTVLLRLVFLLYAEDRGLMSDDETYVKYYSVTGLFERLREDEGHYPDTMDLRYGGWAQLLTLFRLVHDGGRQGKLRLPARHGYLFQPDRYPFLEGRMQGSERQPGERLAPPLVADGVIFRVLHKLMILNGERISYSSLDVEQIGSVYEAIMGFRLEKAGGPSIAVKPAKTHGAPVTINLDALLNVPGKDRGKWLKEQTDQSVTGAALNSLKGADKPEDVVAALDRKVAKDLTPNIVPAGSMVLQPSDERRRSGSHYTPRSLTGPIVRKALEPVLKQLGEQPTPKQLLDLKVCDPAMGSGAFLVEACRQLGDALLKAWGVHGGMPRVPDDETPELFAQRTIAQRCLYGVDKNPMAVDLAKLSLWLATLAKDHPFTFLDHALRCGDSLVGLTRQQIVGFHWQPKAQKTFAQADIANKVKLVTDARREIIEADEFVHYLLKQQKLALAEEALQSPRLIGDLVIAAFFSADKDRQRQENRDELYGLLEEYWGPPLRLELRKPLDKAVAALRKGEKGITPFHWQIEYPEVFGRENPGFDCIVGNPPFAGKNTIIDGSHDGYLDWLKALHEESHGNSDLVAHFFRRAFNLLRSSGTFGLIATNTIAQGDTRASGLRWLCTHGGTIYSARRRHKWPGQAAVVVSVIHVVKRQMDRPYSLDGKDVPLITAYLFHAGGHENPATLKANADKSFIGSYVLGMGFTFDDTDKDGVASPLAEMQRLIAKDKRNAERIFPYIGGEEVNDSPTHAHHRYVINFGEMTEAEARRWPDLVRIVEEKVKPERLKQNREIRARYWWRFGETTPALFSAINARQRVLVCPIISNKLSFAFLPAKTVFSHKLAVFPFQSTSAFGALQSRCHEVWARFFSSTMKDDLNYSPSDCFETFPFPTDFETDPQLEAAGKAYYDFRAALMVQNNEGLTKTYNRFHDPSERSPDIQKLRDLHAAMDRAVLDAYGWADLKPTCDFLLDYEEEDDDEESSGRQRKKPWRYRWPDEFRDEVLARLLELNKKRAEEEALAGPAGAKEKKAAKARAGRKKRGQDPEGPAMF
ncbi:MAG: N-6 DNA methylase [Planctomycetia bacterium]|nr:N-6 DNA methylase [Planctomycetia bacterium]